jgi:hypothetical protein
MRLEGSDHTFLMVRDGAPDSASALPGERLLTTRNESHQTGIAFIAVAAEA